MTKESSSSEPRLGHVEANGLRFAYLELGSGPLALLLHGFPDTAHGWQHLMGPLAAAGYRVVAPFTRGYAPTEAPPTSVTTLAELAADALALIEALGHQSAVLIGHDWGAATAYLAAATEPSKISTLITVAIPHPATIKPSLGLLWAGRHFIGLRLPGALRRITKNNAEGVLVYYRRWSPTWNFGPEETRPVRECFSDPKAADAAIGYYRGAKPGHIAPQLREKLAIPTLAVAGAEDAAVPLANYEAARRKFSGRYEVVVLPGGHFPHRECPDGFRDAVLGFLA